MKPEEITALAREYAEIACPEFAYKGDKELRDDDIKGETISIEAFLRFLLRRYALVEKEEAKAKYQEAKERYLNPDDEIEKTMYGGRMSLLEYLFPDLAKEVEE